ncbi:proprotein_convertase subtilisin/kexin type 5-like [Hexamita inflata]|uniref:Proprotein convertase subtilisin/kexin type 5-like n=1 Tax=Hexamita inflata TaxID=28002 RepID=A0AA86R3T3_9EUKA|nr:proprotein convertase subtilisin/kexin type 5-like [Hexamita inflata]
MIIYLLILNIKQKHVCPQNQLVNQGICVKNCPKSRNYVYDEECHRKCPDKQIFMLQKENGIHCLNECPNNYTIKENFCISVHQHKGVILCPPKSYQLKGQCVQQSEYPNIYISSDGKFYNEKCEDGEKIIILDSDIYCTLECPSNHKATQQTVYGNYEECMPIQLFNSSVCEKWLNMKIWENATCDLTEFQGITYEINLSKWDNQENLNIQEFSNILWSPSQL